MTLDQLEQSCNLEADIAALKHPCDMAEQANDKADYLYERARRAAGAAATAGWEIPAAKLRRIAKLAMDECERR